MCLEDNKKYTVSASKLELEDGLGLAESNLKKGIKVIWNCNGVPYDAEISEVLGKSSDCVGIKSCKPAYLIDEERTCNSNTDNGLAYCGYR